MADKKDAEVTVYEAAYKGDYEKARQLLDDDPSLLLQTDDVSFKT